MAKKQKKKIMLFIVEGPSDETSLATVLSRIFSSDYVRFQVVHGDILTRDFVDTKEIVDAVGEQVKSFCRGIYDIEKDICKVVHLTDMDGVYVPDEAIIERATDGQLDPIYTCENIITSGRERIIDRNKRKQQNIEKLSRRGKICKIPYSFYYFSCNLDHVLHGQNNLSATDKQRLATEFDLHYADDPNAFIKFMKEDSFAVSGTYSETWTFIKQGIRSLERYSNFGLELPDECDWKI